MPDMEVTYYTGDWTDAEREAVRAALESQGFTVSEGGGLQRSAGGPILEPQLILDSGLAIGAAAAGLAKLISAVAQVCKALKDKGPKTSVQVMIRPRIYIVPVRDEDQTITATDAILKDTTDERGSRRGDMTWSGDTWQTVDELFGKGSKPAPQGPRKGRPPEERTRKRKGRRSQTR